MTVLKQRPHKQRHNNHGDSLDFVWVRCLDLGPHVRSQALALLDCVVSESRCIRLVSRRFHRKAGRQAKWLLHRFLRVTTCGGGLQFCAARFTEFCVSIVPGSAIITNTIHDLSRLSIVSHRLRLSRMIPLSDRRIDRCSLPIPSASRRSDQRHSRISGTRACDRVAR